MLNTPRSSVAVPAFVVQDRLVMGACAVLWAWSWVRTYPVAASGALTQALEGQNPVIRVCTALVMMSYVFAGPLGVLAFTKRLRVHATGWELTRYAGLRRRRYDARAVARWTVIEGGMGRWRRPNYLHLRFSDGARATFTHTARGFAALLEHLETEFPEARKR